VDGDGITNLAEYQAGTTPTASTSAFRLLSIRPESNTANLYFTHAAGRQYTIRWSDDLPNWQTATNPALSYSSTWLTKLGTNLIYPSPVFSVWRDTNAASLHRFYRVGAQ
jgi:hypothetical protein